MNEIHKCVAQARRRLTLQCFLQAWPVTVAATLLVALVAVAWPKVQYVPIADERWPWYWLIGAIGTGTLAALGWTWLRRSRTLDAAIELDRRCRLKERLSSTLALDAATLTSAAGEALVADARRAAVRVEVPAVFPIRLQWRSAIPLLIAFIVTATALFFDNAGQKTAQASSIDRARVQQEIKKSVEDLKKKLAERKKLADKQGAAETKELFEMLQKQLDDVQKKPHSDYKKTFVKINNLAKEIEKRQSELGGVEEIAKQLKEQVKDMPSGPAERLARALKNGRWDEAKREIEKLAKQIEEGKLSDQEKKQLQQQLKKLKEQVEQLKQSYEQAREELKQQIEQKRQEGDLEAASKLQEKLDRLTQQQQQMDRLSEMAKQMGKCQSCLQNGDGQGASEALQKLAESASEMEAEAGELQSLGEALDDIADAKDAIASACQKPGANSGNQRSNQWTDKPGDGLGNGPGQGSRPEEETETGGYKSRVRGTPKKGEVVRVGDANGPNRAGQSRVQASEQVEAAFREDPDPIVNEKLPRAEKRHATEYFEKLREGK